MIVIAALIVGPLAIWAAISLGGGDGDQKGLLVQRSTGLTGERELLISLRDSDVTVSGGKDFVRIECEDGQGNVIVEGTQPWPFLSEPGYDYSHVHMAADAEKVDLARRCRVLGTSKQLEADVR